MLLEELPRAVPIGLGHQRSRLAIKRVHAIAWVLLALVACCLGTELPVDPLGSEQGTLSNSDGTLLWPIYDQDFDWEQQEANANIRIRGGGVQDAAGFLYFVGLKTLSPQDATTDTNIFVAKLDSNQVIQWTKEFGTEQNDEATSIAILDEPDGTQKLYVLAETLGFMDESGHALNGFGKFGKRDVVLIKLSLDGAKLWARQFGTTEQDFGYGITIEDVALQSGQASSPTILVTGSCQTNQLDEIIEVSMPDVTETRWPFTLYESQTSDAAIRKTVTSKTYDFAASFSPTGDLLDFAMDGGITLIPKRVRINENGMEGSYYVVLNRKPLNTVTIQPQQVMLPDASGKPLSQVDYEPSSLVFTPTNWNIQQLIRVTPIDDSIAEGIHFAAISHSSASNDPNYNGNETPFLLGNSMVFQIEDNDQATLQLSRSHLFVVEGGVTDSYTIALTSQPWYDVQVTIQPLHGAQVTVNPTQLTFTPSNWKVAQQVQVTAVDDALSENEYGGLHYGGKILHFSVSRDFRYHTRRPLCYMLRNCDVNDATSCLDGSQVPTARVRVCDLVDHCDGTLGNGACIVQVTDDPNVVVPPARFGSPKLDPAGVLDEEEDTTPWTYALLTQLLVDQQKDSNPLTGAFVEPPAELRSFVLSFLGVLNLEEAHLLLTDGGGFPRVLYAICAGIQRLSSHRWSFGDESGWPAGHATRVIQAAIAMFPGLTRRHLWNCGSSSFHAPFHNTLDVSIWDNDPGITLSKASLKVDEAGLVQDVYSIVLNTPPFPASSETTLKSSKSFCRLVQDDACGLWNSPQDFVKVATGFYPPAQAQLSADGKTSYFPNVSIAFASSHHFQVTPSLVTFDTNNWFIPQQVVVKGIDDGIDSIDANSTLKHFVQASLYGYTDSTSFWIQGTLPTGSWFASVPAGSGAMPFAAFPWMASSSSVYYNSMPTVFYSPQHRVVNVLVHDTDDTSVLFTPPADSGILLVKEQLDTINWVGDFAVSPAFDDISVTKTSVTMSQSILSALRNVLMISSGSTTYLKVQLPSFHSSGTSLHFWKSWLRLHPTPFKVFNTSDATEASPDASAVQEEILFASIFTMRVTLVTNDWAQNDVLPNADGTPSARQPQELTFLTPNALQMDVEVAKSRWFELEVTALLQQAWRMQLAVVGLKLEVLDGTGSLQFCSSSFERTLRPHLRFGYRLDNLIDPKASDGIKVSQSSTFVTVASQSMAALLAVDGQREYDQLPSALALQASRTTQENDPWWQVALPVMKKIGNLAIFVTETLAPADLDHPVVLWAVVSTIAFDADVSKTPTSLEAALNFGCPQNCVLSRRFEVRTSVLLWQLEAAMQFLRIYREGNGVLELLEVEVYEPLSAGDRLKSLAGRNGMLTQLSATGDAKSIRARSRLDWTSQTASDSWRIFSTTKDSQEGNLALGMPASQSSTEPVYALPSMAVDGKEGLRWDPLVPHMDTSQQTSTPLTSQQLNQLKQQLLQHFTDPFPEARSTRTKAESHPWWQVDLGKIQAIRKVRVVPSLGTFQAQDCSTLPPQQDVPFWAGSLFTQSQYDPLTQLSKPFAQSFVITLSNQSLVTTPDAAVVQHPVAYSCRNGVQDVIWDQIWQSARFVRVELNGNGVLMLDEVEVIEWNAAVWSRLVLVDLRSQDGNAPVALNALTLFDATSAKAPVTYTIKAMSSQASASGNGAASSLLITGDPTQCFVGNSASFHEWLLLEVPQPTQFGSIEINANVTKCPVPASLTKTFTSLKTASSLSIATYAFDIQDDVIQAATGSVACSVDATGRVVTGQAVDKCDVFKCDQQNCRLANLPGPSLDAFTSLVVLGNVDFMPMRRLPLNAMNSQTMVLRDNPVHFWAFDDSNTQMDAFQQTFGVQIHQTTTSSSVFAIDDKLEQTQLNTAVASTPAMKSFTVETWCFFDQDPTPSPPINLLTVARNTQWVVAPATPSSQQIDPSNVLAEIGINGNKQVFVSVHNAPLGKQCQVALPDELQYRLQSGIWYHIIASYDQIKAVIVLSVIFQPQAGVFPTVQAVESDCSITVPAWTKKWIQIGQILKADGTVLKGFVGKFTRVAWYLHQLTQFEVLDHFRDFVEQKLHCSYALRLGSKPLTPVVVDLDAEDACYRFGLCNISVVPSKLTFDAFNYDQFRVVQLLGVDDRIYEGFVHSNSIKSKVATLFSGFALTSFVETIDFVGFQTLELPTVQSFYDQFVLTKKLPVASDALVQAQQAIQLLQTQWATQSLVNDFVADDMYTAQLQVATTDLNIWDVTLPGVDFSTFSLAVSEDGKGNDYQLVLTSEPKTDVVVTLNANTDCYRPCFDDLVDAATRWPCASFVKGKGQCTTDHLLCNISITPAQLTFKASDWYLPQRVRVVAIDDFLDEDDVHLSLIKSSVASNDLTYDNLFLPDVLVAIEDNDDSHVTFSSLHLVLNEAPPAKTPDQNLYPLENTYNLVLETEPWANVTVAMSNQADGTCYRMCGYHFDDPKCGLPRQQSVSRVTLTTNSSSEIQQLSISTAKVTEVQQITISSGHVDQILRLAVVGGFAAQKVSLNFQFSTAFKAKYTSSKAVAGKYMKTFRVSCKFGTASNPQTLTTGSLDGFASAEDVAAALTASCFSGSSSSISVSRVLAYESSSTLSWFVTFNKLYEPQMPSLAISADVPFEGTLGVKVEASMAAPAGSFFMKYASSPEAFQSAKAAEIPLGGTALDMEKALKQLAGIYGVSVKRTVTSGTRYGYDFTVTFSSVDSYGNVSVAPSTIFVAASAVEAVSFTVTELQPPILIGGFFNVTYSDQYGLVVGSNVTNPISYDASESELALELAQLAGIGPVQVSKKRLTAENANTWTIEFAQNVGNLQQLGVVSHNLTGNKVTVQSATVREGVELGGYFVLEHGGMLKRKDDKLDAWYTMPVASVNSSNIPFNVTGLGLAQAIAAMKITGQPVVTRQDIDCDLINKCRGYIWTISFVNSAGDLPPMNIYYAKSLSGSQVAVSFATIANGTYLSGRFSLGLELLADDGTLLTAKTWNLPVNVTPEGMDEALEAIPWVTSNREAEYDPETGMSRGPKFDKGVRVYRDGPFFDGGHTWRLEWALADFIRFQDLKITIDSTLVTQEVEPLLVPSQFDLNGMPRCSSIPNSHFEPDVTDTFGLRGHCVYDVVTNFIQERLLCNYTVTNPWIVFEPSKWCMAQGIHVLSTNDFVDESTAATGNWTFSSVIHTVFSDDLIYLAETLDSVVIQVQNEDVAQVLVSEKSLEVSEDGVLDASYFLTLASEPFHDVQIQVLPWLDSTNTGCYRFGLCNLTIPVAVYLFTPRDWDIPQKVMVYATDDHLDEADRHMTGISHFATSQDAKYHRIAIPSIVVTVQDNDVSKLVVDLTTVSVTEGGTTDQYQVVLNSEPFAKVAVYVENIAGPGDSALASPSVLYFTWRDWNISQTVVVTAFDDFTEDRVNSSSVLQHSIVTNDLIYNNLKNLPQVDVLITDNDVSGIELSTVSIQMLESRNASYQVRLHSEPWHQVTLVPSSTKYCFTRLLDQQTSCNITLITKQLVFTPTNWSTWSKVNFTAFDDSLQEQPVHLSYIAHATSSADPLYVKSDYSNAAGTVQVAITDNDVSFVNISLALTGANGVSIARSELHAAEGGFNDSYQIFLNSEPYEEVFVTIRPLIESVMNSETQTVAVEPQVSVSAGNSRTCVSAAALSRGDCETEIQLVFNSLNWFVPKTINVLAVDDKIPENPLHRSVIQHACFSNDVNYNISNSSIGVKDVQIVINDREAIAPPVPVSAIFDPSGTKITVTFDSIVFHRASMNYLDSTSTSASTVSNLSGSDSFASFYSMKYKTFGCDLVFNLTSSTAKYSLGDKSNCFWMDYKRLRIVLGSSATITVRDMLVLRSCDAMVDNICTSSQVLRARPYSRGFSQTSVSVAIPNDIVRPTPTLMVPENVGSCGKWQIDASLSGGNGGRAFTRISYVAILKNYLLNSVLSNVDDFFARTTVIYANLDALCVKYKSQWLAGVSTSTLSRAEVANDLTFISNMDQLRASCYLRNQMQSASAILAQQVVIDSTFIEPGTSYVFGLELQNAFGMVTRTMKYVDVGTLPGPAVFIVGDVSREISRVGDPLVMEADATVSCPQVTGTAVGFKWFASVEQSTKAVDFNSSNTAKSPRSLRVARHLLEAGQTYRFMVEASMVNYAKASKSYATVVVTVRSSSLIATLIGGDRTIGERDILVLNGSLSSDPDFTMSPMTYSWSCQDVTNLTSDCVNTSASTMNQVVPLKLPQNNSNPILTIAPFNLQLQRMLQFTLTVQKQPSNNAALPRNKSTSLHVWTLAGSLPVVTTAKTLTKVNPALRVPLEATVQSVYPYTARWTQAQGDLNMSSSENDTTDRAFALPLTSLSNAILKNQLTPGLTYVFRLVATDINDNTGFGAVTIIVNSPPSSGKFAVSPHTGAAIQDLFQMECTEWTDDPEDLPLRYSFGMIPASTRTLEQLQNDSVEVIRKYFTPIVVDQASPRVSSNMLPPSNGQQSENITLVAFIKDTLDSCAVALASIQVVIPEEIRVNPVQFVSGLFDATNNASYSVATLSQGDTSKMTKYLLSAAMLMEHAMTSNGTDNTECPKNAANGQVCSAHGNCNPTSLVCVCSDNYFGADCSIEQSQITQINKNILASLQTAAKETEPTSAGLYQQALVVDVLLRTSSDTQAIDSSTLDQVMDVSTSIVQNAMAIPEGTSDFLDKSGSSMVQSLSFVMTAEISNAKRALQKLMRSQRRLQQAEGSSSDMANDDNPIVPQYFNPECAIDAQDPKREKRFTKVLQTLQFLAAMGSRDLLPEEAAFKLNSSQLQTYSVASGGAGLQTDDAVSLRLSSTAKACLPSDQLYLNAFVFQNTPHSLCSLNESSPISHAATFSIHSSQAYDAVASGKVSSIDVETLHNNSLCVKTTLAEAASSAASSVASTKPAALVAFQPTSPEQDANLATSIFQRRRLGEAPPTAPETSGSVANSAQANVSIAETSDANDSTSATLAALNSNSLGWRPLISLEVAHATPLTSLQVRNFTTVCSIWSASRAKWTKNEICFKDETQSNANKTICVCNEIAQLELLITLEEKLAFYELFKDRYRHDQVSHVNIFWILAVLAFWFALVPVANRLDRRDAKLHKDKVVKTLNRSKWHELEQRTKHFSLEVIDAFTAPADKLPGGSDKKSPCDPSPLDATTSTGSSQEPGLEPEDPSQLLNATLPNEIQMLCSNETLLQQYTIMTAMLRVGCVVLMMLGILLVFVGIDFVFVLGNFTSEILLFVYGKQSGIAIWCFGGILTGCGVYGLLVAHHEATHVSRRFFSGVVTGMVFMQVFFVGIALKLLQEMQDQMPSTVVSTLTSTWFALPSETQQELQESYGCCGFLRLDDTSLPCPEESLEAFPERNCLRVLTHQAKQLFDMAFVYFEVLLVVELVVLLCVNALVKWRFLRVQYLAALQVAGSNDASEAIAATRSPATGRSQVTLSETQKSLLRAIYSSLTNVALLGILPFGFELLMIVSVLAMAFGVDGILQGDVLQNWIVAAFFGLESGVILIVVGCVCCAVLLFGYQSLLLHRWRGLRHFLLLASGLWAGCFGILVVLANHRKNLQVDRTFLHTLLYDRFVQLSLENLMAIETSLHCCGYDVITQTTTCDLSQITSSTPAALVPNTCSAQIEAIVTHFIEVAYHQWLGLVALQLATWVVCLVLYLRVKKFDSNPKVRPHAVLPVRNPPKNRNRDEFKQNPVDVVLRRGCQALVMFICWGGCITGLFLMALGADVLYSFNVLHVAYILQAIHPKLGLYLMILGGGITGFAIFGALATWKRWKRLLQVFLVLLVVLFVVAIAGIGTFHKFTRKDLLASPKYTAKMEQLWESAPAHAKHFTQNYFQCCGLTKQVASNGTVSYKGALQIAKWSLTGASSSNTTNGVTTISTLETVCPDQILDGCDVFMQDYIVAFARKLFQSSIALASCATGMLVATNVLYWRQGKRSFKGQAVGWKLLSARVVALLSNLIGVLGSLAVAWIAIDILLQWNWFSSSLFQLVFSSSYGMALLVAAGLNFTIELVTFQVLYALKVYGLFFQQVYRMVMALSLWICVILIAYVTHWGPPSKQQWRAHLESLLDSKWNMVGDSVKRAIGVDYDCCGFYDPVVLNGVVFFDRPGVSQSCSLLISKGCVTALGQQVHGSFHWLFIALICWASLQTCQALCSYALFWSLKPFKPRPVYAIQSRLEYARGKFTYEMRRKHGLWSLMVFYDRKFTRPQRILCVATSWLASLALFTWHFATRECFVDALVTCDNFVWYEFVAYGVLYGGLVALFVQKGLFGLLYEHIRHRRDHESESIASARQRKEKVLLFPMTSAAMAATTKVVATGSRPRSSTEGFMESTSSSMESHTQVTSEEKWYHWSCVFFLWLFQTSLGCLLLTAMGFAILMALVQVGYKNQFYGISLRASQGPVFVLGLCGVCFGNGLLGFIALELKRYQSKRSLKAFGTFSTVACVNCCLVIALGVVFFMVSQVSHDIGTFEPEQIAQAASSSATSKDINWTIRQTLFSVVAELWSKWLHDKSGFYRNRIQKQFGCCGFRNATNLPFDPCPLGTEYQVDLQAQKVDGTVVNATQEQHQELPGCLGALMTEFAKLQLGIGLCLLVAGLFALSNAISSAFLAYDLWVSRDEHLKLRVDAKLQLDQEKSTTTKSSRNVLANTFQRVIGLHIQQPARGKLLSKMLSTSLDAVSPALASELAQTGLSNPSASTVSTAVTAANAGSGAALTDDAAMGVSPSLGQAPQATNNDDQQLEEVMKQSTVPYPWWVVNVVLALGLLWTAAMMVVVVIYSLRLGRDTSWQSILAWSISVVLQHGAFEPFVIFLQLVWSTLGVWWQQTWVMRLVRFGRMALKIHPDNATNQRVRRLVARTTSTKRGFSLRNLLGVASTSPETKTSFQLFERIRHQAAVQIQRHVVTRVDRQRFLQSRRQRQEEMLRDSLAKRQRRLKEAMEYFTQEEIDAFRVVFANEDHARIGLVSYEFIPKCVHDLGVFADKHKVHEILRELDPAFADLVDFEHFLFAMQSIRQLHQEAQQAKLQNLQQNEWLLLQQNERAIAEKQQLEEFLNATSVVGFGDVDPSSKLQAKRQNLLRELKEKRDSLHHQLLAKMKNRGSKTGNSSKRWLPPLENPPSSSSVGAPLLKKSDSLDVIDLSTVAETKPDLAQRPTTGFESSSMPIEEQAASFLTTTSDGSGASSHEPEPKPSGAFVLMTNRRLSPKKRIIQTLLHRKHGTVQMDDEAQAEEQDEHAVGSGAAPVRMVADASAPAAPSGNVDAKKTFSPKLKLTPKQLKDFASSKTPPSKPTTIKKDKHKQLGAAKSSAAAGATELHTIVEPMTQVKETEADESGKHSAVQ